MWDAVCERVHPTADNREIALENTQSWKKKAVVGGGIHMSLCVFDCVYVCVKDSNIEKDSWRWSVWV